VPVGVVSRTKDVSHFRSGKVRWCHVKGNSEERTVPFLLKLKTLKCFSITMSLAPQQKPGISEIPGFLVLMFELLCQQVNDDISFVTESSYIRMFAGLEELNKSVGLCIRSSIRYFSALYFPDTEKVHQIFRW
jgi:hypothetical protein